VFELESRGFATKTGPDVRPYPNEKGFEPGDGRSERPYGGEDAAVVAKLTILAGIFVGLQDKRHEADYDTSRQWTFTRAAKEVLAGKRAFQLWDKIENAKIAQEYRVSLLTRLRD